MKLEAQHRAGARVITGCTKSTPIQALLKEAGLLSLSDHGDTAAARLRERALRDRQYTPIAQDTQQTEGPTAWGVSTRCTRSQAQGQRQHFRCSWRVASETVAKGAGLDTVTVEPVSVDSHGQISTIKATQDAYGGSWRGSGRRPVPLTGNERKRD